MSAMLRRPITSGSRQAPDPYDQFLESRHLYRKHTARDASCLFRVIAEQMYDTQMLHYEVRLECVRFMTRKRRIFETFVRGDFDSYLRDMMKPRTYGTMLELRAVCCMYRRNAILYEPYNLGSVVTYSSQYKDNFKVFYTNEYHFDSVFTVDYIKEAALCQSISFKLLYKMLFKLPDVKYAAEAMLHPHTFDWGNCEVNMDSRGYVEHINCRDGRTFHLDMPENTLCILENSKLCNFHNIRFSDNNENNNASTSSSVFGLPSNNLTGRSKSLDLLYLCPNRFNSCVRQLLDDGITPFPYKVAKSLDTYMYRNIEFDSWNDVRKEAKRYNVYTNDYNFKVPYLALHPLPPDEFRPWAVPFRFRRHMQHNMQLGKHMPKPKPSKWKKNKLYDVNYFETNNSDAVRYLQMGDYYGRRSFYHDEPQQQHRQHEILEQAEQPTGLQQPPLQQQQLPTQLPEAGAAAAAVLQQKQLVAAPYVNYLTPPWMNPSPPMPEEYQQASLFSRPPPPLSDSCMYMHYGGCAPPPLPLPPTAPVQTQHLPLPAFMMAPPKLPPPPPPPSFAAHQFSSNSSNYSGNSNRRNSCSNSVPMTSATRSIEDQSEQRPSLYNHGEELPTHAAADLLALQQYYNDLSTRMAQVYNQDDHLRRYYNSMYNGNVASHHNLIDQQQQRWARNAGLTTPPPTPDVASTSVGGIRLSDVAASMQKANEKERGAAPKRNYNLNKGRSKPRPAPLADIGQIQNFAQASMLPTPSPSPNTQDNKFLFYPAPHSSPSAASQSAYQSPAQSSTKAFYAAIKAGQNPYAWNRTPIAPPSGPMVETPCDLFHNYRSEQYGGYNAQKPLPPSNYAPPRH